MTREDNWLDRYWHALLLELELRAGGLSDGVQTACFGGGTASLLEPNSVAELLQTLESFAEIAPNAEITLECNPGTDVVPKLPAYREVGITRLSAGVQSFRENNLKRLGRIHTAEEARNTLTAATQAQFHSVGADLIFGIPDQTVSEWEYCLGQCVEPGADHISTYELTVEPATKLGEWVRRKHMQIPPEEEVAEMFRLTHEFLERQGFIHYQVSNYARPGFQSKHNVAYRERKPYVSSSPPAHSFDRKRRWWNVASVKDYIFEINRGNLPVAVEEYLGKHQAALKTTYLGSRTTKEIGLEKVRKLVEDSAVQTELLKAAIPSVQFVAIEDGFIRPTLEAYLPADSLATGIAGRMSPYIRENKGKSG